MKEFPVFQASLQFGIPCIVGRCMSFQVSRMSIDNERTSPTFFRVSGSHDVYVSGASSFMIRRCLEQTAGSHVTEGWF